MHYLHNSNGSVDISIYVHYIQQYLYIYIIGMKLVHNILNGKDWILMIYRVILTYIVPRKHKIYMKTYKII